jgi:hypothetical protein
MHSMFQNNAVLQLLKVFRLLCNYTLVTSFNTTCFGHRRPSSGVYLAAIYHTALTFFLTSENLNFARFFCLFVFLILFS